jgi:DNA-binding response OmpR family regulator
MTQRRVLVVDDNVDVCAVVALKLEAVGIVVERRFDGISALELVRESRFDAIILDVDMPGISGIEVVSALRTAGNTVPVIMVSGKTYEHEIAAGLQAGANDYLTKPFSPSDLLARVQALFAPLETRPV